MQVFQLIERLMDLDPNAEVHFSYNYGDHWHTEVAQAVGSVEEGVVKYSEPPHGQDGRRRGLLRRRDW